VAARAAGGVSLKLNSWAQVTGFGDNVRISCRARFVRGIAELKQAARRPAFDPC
jgi:hypothetical protein